MRLLFFITLLLPSFALANPERTPHVTAQIVTEEKSLVAGEKSWIGIRLTMEDHWHTYWKNPGDSGLPTKVEWNIPKEWKISDAHFFLPQRIPLGPIVNFGYEGETLVGFTVEVPKESAASEELISADVSWLVCKEECIPESVTLKTKISITKQKTKKNPWAKIFSNLRSEQETSLSSSTEIHWSQDEENIVGKILPNIDFGKVLDTFPLDQKVLSPEPANIQNLPNEIILRLKKRKPAPKGERTLKLLLVTDKGTFSYEKELTLGSTTVEHQVLSSTDSDQFSIGIILFFAFLGGLLLNFMPCVFPVLGIKALSLLKTSKAEARKNGIIYSLGILVSFWFLTLALIGLRSGGAEIGWGFQLQNLYFITFLVFLFSFMSANLAGFFEIPSSFIGVGSSLAGKEGALGSFFTGALTVVVATPCSAPFMSTAVGVALSQSTGMLFFIFSFLAIGLACPFLLLSFFPGFVRFMPKPGNWMNRLKEFFSIPLVLTVVWLLWVLSLQTESFGVFQVLVGLIVFFSGIWLLQKFSSSWVKGLGLLLLVVGVLVAFKIKSTSSLAAQADDKWRTYNVEKIQEDIKNQRTVFIDFTAAWCVTCQVNKKLVLTTDSMMKYFQDKEIRLYRADWTNNDVEITRALQQIGRASVPVYLVLKPDGQKVILPQLLTEEIVKKEVP